MWSEWLHFYAQQLNVLIPDVREIDLISHLPEALLLLDEMITNNGHLRETNHHTIQRNVLLLSPTSLMF
jgi:hypothetical protein